MKSIIIFALLSLAICQSPADIITGFTNQLALSDVQTTDVNICLNGLVGQIQGLAPVYMDYLSQDFESLVADAAALVENLEPAVQAACGPIVQDLETYTVTFGNGQDTKLNLESNGAYVAQQLGVLIQHVAEHNFTGIGQTIGYLYQIAIGSVDLPPLAEQQLTSEQLQTLHQNAMTLATDQDALTQFLEAYVDELGLALQVNVPALVQLVSDAQSLIIATITLQNSLYNGNFDSDITSIEDFITTVLEFARNNQQGLQSVVTIDGPIFNALVRHPLEFIGNVIYNGLLKYPQAIELTNQIQQDLIAGDFTATGTDSAAQVKIYYGKAYADVY